MRQLNGDGKQDFKVKNTPLKHTDGKGRFLQVDKGGLFFKKNCPSRNSKYMKFSSRPIGALGLF